MAVSTLETYTAGQPHSRWARVETVSLGMLYGFTVMAVLGYGVYGLHPQLIPQTGFAMRFFSVSFQLFARLHIVLAAVALALVLLRRLRWTWLAPFAAVYALSFTAEHVGTGYGIPFGGYHYTGLLGAKLGGRVPFLIPVSWFLVALPAWILARKAFPSSGARVQRIALGSAWLVIWDLALDPAMSFLTPYWVWDETGPYYGMPMLNLVGWFVTGLVLLTAIEAFGRRVPWHTLDVRWAAAYYGAMLLMPLGMLVAAQEWLGVAVTAAAVGAGAALTLRLGATGTESASRVGFSPEVVEA